MARMATQKRRVIYLTDEQWADLQAQARGEKTTISNLIRHGMARVPKTEHESAPVEFHAPRPSEPEPVIDPIHWATAVDTSSLRHVGPPFTPVPKRR